MRFAILDTGVWIDHWQGTRSAEALAEVRQTFIVRHSAVVLSELRRGARTRYAIERIDALRKLAPVIWEPLAQDWWRAGELVQTIGDKQDWETNKRREFQNDALIALTAARHGAAVITTNKADFTLLSKPTGIRVIALG
jgi:predicted nucleic acid-binding protein